MHSLPHQNEAPTPTLPSAALLPSESPVDEFKGFPYDMEDIGLNAVELQAKYAAGEHDFHSRADWNAAVAGSDSKLDYWDWLLTMIAIDDENY